MSTSNQQYPKDKSFTFTSGAFNGVDDSVEPYDDQPNLMTDAKNGYFPDPQGGSGFYARPGCTKSTAPASVQDCREVFSCISAGIVYNFVMLTKAGVGKLYRLSGTFPAVTYTDVTPVGVAISNLNPGGGAIFMTQLNNQLIVSDGTNRPWIGTNLGATPITGTYIDADGSGTSWASIGEPQVYQGSLFFISVTTFANVTANISIIWSEPNQPSVGYMQSGYADFWNLIQTGTTPLYALKATNSGLYYFRVNSIGLLTGTPSINFQNTATHDVVSANIGTVSSKTVKAFSNFIYFCDAVGRPWRMAIGGNPEPIWLKMRAQYEAFGPCPSQLMQHNAWAVVEPNLNKYICFLPWSLATDNNPNTGYVFDAVTGGYEGRWQVGDWGTSNGPVLLVVGGIIVDASTSNNSWLLIIGSSDNIGSNYGTAWGLNTIGGGVWNDGAGAAVMPILAQTQRLGYSASTEWTLNTVRAIAASVTPISLTSTASEGVVSQGTQTPPASSDQTNLAQWQPQNTMGRGFLLQLAPTTATSQWRLFRVEGDCTAADVVAGAA